MTQMVKHTEPQGLSADSPRTPGALSKTPFTDALQPRTYEQALEWCRSIARENWVPACYRGQPMFVGIAVQFGERLGLSPLACIQNLAVINGKPCMYGDMMLAIARSTAEFVDYREEYYPKDAGKVGCTVTITRKNQSPIVETFDEEDAKRADLWRKKGPWTNYPARMCMWRARGFALRTAFPDYLSGIITREEAEDWPTVDPQGNPAPKVTGPKQDAEEPLSTVSIEAAQKCLESASTWAQFIEGEAQLKALQLPKGEDRTTCTRLYKEARERLVNEHREAFKVCESRAEWLKVSEDYSRAPESVRADMLPEFNAAEARVQRLEDQEDAKWQDDQPAQDDAPPPDEDDVPY